MTGFFHHFCKRLTLSSLILALSSVVLLSQNNLSGNLNQPKSHVSVIGVDRVIVDNVAGFAINDTILLIQMQGVQILTVATYGFAQGKSGEPGMHEFMIILSVNIFTREIVFRNNIINGYNVNGNVQIVRVPYFNSATVTGKLFCDPWNPVTKSGGVLAMIVARTLTLNSDIDVSGLGFTGGKDVIGDGICWNTNTVLYGLEFYPESFLNAGFKGEGVANLNESNMPLGTNYMKGSGNNWTGGGGGNGRYSGGGGGSNRGSGGVGGFEDCFPAKSGGNGGVIAAHPSLLDRIYLGGGGGASTSFPTGALSNGGNGGGIVIIVADAIAGNGGNILSNGANGTNKTGMGGSGGGGAGGSIALSLNSYGTSSIGFSATGGNGGDNPGSFGEGGGGSGGLVYVSTNTSANAILTMTGGSPGNGSGSTATGGTAGEKRLGFKAVLNGFLFNSISSSVTGNQIDSICSNILPKKIIGTKPVGGNGPYTYLWEKSFNQVLWTPLTNDADPLNYTPTVIETSTVWFRRTITSSAPDVLVDVSKSVQIVVQPFIKNNIVGNSDTYCLGQDPIPLTSMATLQDGNGIYTFKWEVSLDNINFNLPVNANTAEGYTPPNGLTVTSWYRRTVTSGRCVDFVAIAKITIIPVITNNNITNTPPDICYGSSFLDITATTQPVLTGGDLIYRISWESSLSGVSGWTPAAGVIIAGGFNPNESSASFPGSLYYRRVVKSGINDVCVDNSASVKLNDYPVIVNNAIKTNSVNKPICSGSIPPALIDSLVISGGNNAYAYSWEYRTSTLPWTTVSGITSAVYSPGALTVTTDFRRSVISSACSNISNIITITAHNSILNNSISLLSSGTDTTLCNGGNPDRLIGTVPTGGINSYAYLWLSSTDNVTWTQIPTGGTLRDYDPPALSAPTYYKRQVVSGACLVVSASTVNVNILPLITNNTISGTSAVCKFLVPKVITGATISGGSASYTYLWQESSDGGLTWKSASLINNTSDYQPPALSSPMKYRRYVTSGLKNTCQNTSNVFDISIDPLPLSQIDAGPDDNIFSIQRIYHLKAVSPLSGETGVWKPLNNSAFGFSDSTRNDATASNLLLGANAFLWTVHRGPCKLSDTVNINVYKDLFPQGFSPNEDPYNNTFIIEGLDLDVHYADLRIVNGAGTEVYKSSNRNGQTSVSWNGKNGKGLELPEGTYYYMLNLTLKKTNASVFKKSGFIILKRY